MARFKCNVIGCNNTWTASNKEVKPCCPLHNKIQGIKLAFSTKPDVGVAAGRQVGSIFNRSHGYYAFDGNGGKVLKTTTHS